MIPVGKLSQYISSDSPHLVDDAMIWFLLIFPKVASLLPCTYMYYKQL